MHSNRPSDLTVAYYDDFAQEYTAATFELDMKVLHAPFLARVPEGGSVLEAGCGPGRDARAFRDHGLNVVAFDASVELVRLATELTGLPVHHMTFDDVDWVERFDGVWACASLLHVPRAQLPGVIVRLKRALRPGGVAYMSFKYGTGERVSSGRRFTDMDEASVAALIDKVDGLQILELWRSTDVREDRAGELWLNVLCQRGDVAS